MSFQFQRTRYWFKCLVCQRCFEQSKALIAHRAQSECRFKYRRILKERSERSLHRPPPIELSDSDEEILVLPAIANNILKDRSTRSIRAGGLSIDSRIRIPKFDTPRGDPILVTTDSLSTLELPVHIQTAIPPPVPSFIGTVENDIAQPPSSFPDKNSEMKSNDISFPDKIFATDSKGVIHETAGNGIVPLDNGQKETCPILSTDKTKWNWLRCPICDLVFATDSGLKMHNIIFHNMDVKWNCTECKQYFLFFSIFQGHLKNTPPFAGIDAASYGFSKSQMDKPYGCATCEKNFANKNCCTFHSQTHEGPTAHLKFRCNLCNTHQISANMDRHFEAHKNRSRRLSTPKTTPIPGRVPLTLPESLSDALQKESASIDRHFEADDTHARRLSDSNTSVNPRPPTISVISAVTDKCPNCKEELWNQLGYQKHLQTCEWRKNNPFQCRLCEKRFKTDEARFIHFQQDHRPILQKLLPDKCPNCKEEFWNQLGYQQHLQTCEWRKNNPFQCRLCEKRFKTDEARFIHFQQDHRSILQK